MRFAMLFCASCHSIAVGGLAAQVTELAGALGRLDYEVDAFTQPAPGQRRFACVGAVRWHGPTQAPSAPR